MSEVIHELRLKNYPYYLASRYAPKPLQIQASAIMLLKTELENIPNETSEEMVAEIKLAWWREVITEVLNGQPPRPHPILQALKGYDHNQLMHMVDHAFEPAALEKAMYMALATLLGQKFSGLSPKSVFNLLANRPKRLLFRLLVGNYNFL